MSLDPTSITTKIRLINVKGYVRNEISDAPRLSENRVVVYALSDSGKLIASTTVPAQREMLHDRGLIAYYDLTFVVLHSITFYELYAEWTIDYVNVETTTPLNFNNPVSVTDRTAKNFAV